MPTKLTADQKKMYLVINKDCSVIRANPQSKEFKGGNEKYPKDFIYEGDNVRIYDYNKRSIVPIVKQLLEDFEGGRDIMVVLTFVTCLIAGIFTTLNFFKIGGVGQEAQRLNNSIVAIGGAVNNVSQKTDQIKEKSVVERVMDKQTSSEEAVKKVNKTELENKVEQLETQNRVLEIEKEKMRILANNVEPDRLAIYENIKAEFYEIEKERLKKEVELEYIQGEKEILLEEEKNRIRDEVKRELLQLYQYECTRTLEEEEKAKIQSAFMEKYKEILDNCKKYD